MPPPAALVALGDPVVVALPLGLAAAAVAATSAILVGEPVKNPPGLQLNPKAGLGVIVGSGKLLGVRTADPDGGPQWGLRMVKTSRGLGCVQLGRVVDGKLGVLGRDGAFADDGKFHERGAEIIQQTDCQQTDGAGRVFIAMTFVGLPASGDATGCAARSSSRNPLPVCPKGRCARSTTACLVPRPRPLTYVGANGAVIRRRVSGPDGAYLVVRATEPELRNVGYFSPGRHARKRPAQRRVSRRECLSHHQPQEARRGSPLPAEGLCRSDATPRHARAARHHGPRPGRQAPRVSRPEGQAAQGRAADRGPAPHHHHVPRPRRCQRPILLHDQHPHAACQQALLVRDVWADRQGRDRWQHHQPDPSTLAIAAEAP